jgi:hypothetical protein
MIPTITRQQTTTTDLAEAGFTGAQIERLETLRALYPLLEFVETAEVRRLAFMKWRVEHDMTERP